MDIEDSSVLVVLAGPYTWGRKHADWEISAALNKKVGGRLISAFFKKTAGMGGPKPPIPAVSRKTLKLTKWAFYLNTPSNFWRVL